MACDRCSKQVGAVNIDSPQLAQAINGIVDGLVIFSKAGRCNKVINLAMLFDDFGDASVDGGGVRNVREVSRDFGDSAPCFVSTSELQKELKVLQKRESEFTAPRWDSLS